MATIYILAGCGSDSDSVNSSQSVLVGGPEYEQAWNSEDPAYVVSVFADSATFQINDGVVFTGTQEIYALAKGIRLKFPNLKFKMERFSSVDETFVFHWMLEGTNSGLGGNGNVISIGGYDEWHVNANGLIERSRRFINEADYDHQLAVFGLISN